MKNSLLIALLLAVFVTGCLTDNDEWTPVTVRSGEYSKVVNLPRGEKLISCSWEHCNLSYLTRSRFAEEPLTTNTFRTIQPFADYQLGYSIVFVESK